MGKEQETQAESGAKDFAFLSRTPRLGGAAGTGLPRLIGEKASDSTWKPHPQDHLVRPKRKEGQKTKTEEETVF